jgi:hypothetical protein
MEETYYSLRVGELVKSEVAYHPQVGERRVALSA